MVNSNSNDVKEVQLPTDTVDGQLPSLKKLDVLLQEYREPIDKLLEEISSSSELTQAFQGEDTELLCLRSLLTHKSHEKCLSQIEKNANWRNSHKTYEIPQNCGNKSQHQSDKNDKSEIAANCFGQMISHGFTKQGRGISVVLFGRIDIHRLLKKVTIEEYTHWTLFNTVRDVRLYSKLSRSRNTLLESFVVVDLKGMSTSSIKFLPYLKIDTELGDLLCPSTTGVIALMNVPYAFSLMWSITRPLLSKETLTKIRIFRNEEKACQFLSESVERDQLPQLLGGEAYTPIDEWVSVHDPPMEEMVVRAGKAHEIDVRVESGVTVQWLLAVKNKDVHFSAHFEGETVHERSKICYKNRSRGKFSSEREGRLYLRFDNSHSMFSSKTIHYHVNHISASGSGNNTTPMNNTIVAGASVTVAQE